MPEPAENNSEIVERLLSARTALFVGAHPDDIEFRAGGLVRLMRQHGAEVIFAIATRGGRGWVWPFRSILEWLRVRHQRRAAEILGGAEIVFFGYPDGRLSDHIGRLTDDLRSLIDSRKPDVVLSWDPQHNQNPHRDHQAVAEAVRAACSDPSTGSGCSIGSGCCTCWYGTREPNVWVGFDEETLRRKIRALKAHRTETPYFYFDMRFKQPFIAAMRAEGSKVGCDYAETFRVTPPRRSMRP